ncbi:MAG TPA: hypothetical protein VH458_04435 [Vicinamibacterales bacterium]|jgi:hypothetical protein
MTALVVLAACAMLGGLDQHSDQHSKSFGKESVRIYVFATEAPASASGDSDTTQAEAMEGRQTAVRELKDALRRKAGLSIVDDRAQADVVVEVTDREVQDAGDGGFGGVKLTPLANTIIRTHVTAGSQSTDIKGMGQGAGDRAAKDAADRLLKWIVRNRADRSNPSSLIPNPHPRPTYG